MDSLDPILTGLATLAAPLAPLGLLDAAGVGALLAGWVLFTRAVETETARRPSVSVLMIAHRRAWMHNLAAREARIFDATLLGQLRQGTAFFASTALITLGAGLALLGNIDQLRGLAGELSLDVAPAAIWEIKLLLVLVFMANALLKFVWAHRVFGYCAVMMGAVPGAGDTEEAWLRADQAADLNIAAARAFNRGLRSVYFALSALAWLLGPVALMAATAVTLISLWKREYASATRATLLRGR